MSEKYEDILAEFKYQTINRSDYDTYSDLVFSTFKRIKEAVASDPSQWYVIDEDGNKIYVSALCSAIDQGKQ